jgi:hypothetical protein
MFAMCFHVSRDITVVSGMSKRLAVAPPVAAEVVRLTPPESDPTTPVIPPTGVVHFPVGSRR